MKNSAARKLKEVPTGYLRVGVDPHKKKHAAVGMTEDLMVQDKFKFTNSRRGFEEALERAKADMVRTGCRGIIFAIETTSHYWRNFAYFLDEKGIPFRLINQFALKRRREGKTSIEGRTTIGMPKWRRSYCVAGNSPKLNYRKAFTLSCVPATMPIAGW